MQYSGDWTDLNNSPQTKTLEAIGLYTRTTSALLRNRTEYLQSNSHRFYPPDLGGSFFMHKFKETLLLYTKTVISTANPFRLNPDIYSSSYHLVCLWLGYVSLISASFRKNGARLLR
jgi:hypothetical protein